MAQLVDEEVRKLLDGAYQDASRIVTENLDKLHVLANALLERETLDSDDIITVFEGRELPPLPEEEEEAKVDGRRDSAAGAGGRKAGTERGASAAKLEPAASFESAAKGERTKPEP
jgi:cell division protease FtsH